LNHKHMEEVAMNNTQTILWKSRLLDRKRVDRPS
jgi:hypothetical protein